MWTRKFANFFNNLADRETMNDASSDSPPTNETRIMRELNFPDAASFYEEVLIGMWPGFQALAAARGKSLVWVATNGEMSAKASNNWRRLLWSESPPEIITWGQLVQVERRKPGILQNFLIVGDLDFEPGNNVRRMLSDDGSIGHGEVLAAIGRLIRNSKVDYVALHREGWEQAFVPKTMLAEQEAAAAPHPEKADQEIHDQQQAIVAARFCGPLFLLPLAYRIFTGANLREGWDWGGVLCVLAGVLMVIWGYSSKLPKK